MTLETTSLEEALNILVKEGLISDIVHKKEDLPSLIIHQEEKELEDLDVDKEHLMPIMVNKCLDGTKTAVLETTSLNELIITIKCFDITDFCELVDYKLLKEGQKLNHSKRDPLESYQWALFSSTSTEDGPLNVYGSKDEACAAAEKLWESYADRTPDSEKIFIHCAPYKDGRVQELKAPLWSSYYETIYTIEVSYKPKSDEQEIVHWVFLPKSNQID